MMKQSSNKSYSSPELKLQQFASEDVITASDGDNLGGIPDGWAGIDARGGGF